MCDSCRNGGKPVAGIWARVSTESQTEMSLDTQVSDLKPWLESQGFLVPSEKIIKVSWTSQEVLECPRMADILGWSKTGEIHALGVTHDDRLSGTAGSKAIILEVLAKSGVRYLPKYTPLPEGSMGETMSILNAMNKRDTGPYASHSGWSWYFAFSSKFPLPISFWHHLFQSAASLDVFFK